MANVQQYFDKFHENIRTYYEINKTLREKKDIILDRIKRSLKEKGRPSCTPFLQGSYKMKVGICALKGAEFDIDVGLRFDFSENDYAATEVRQWVFEAVDGHTEKVEAKNSCIRVSYKDGYHVDLVPYAWWDDANKVEQHRLAHKQDGWRPADPPALVKYVVDVRVKFDGSEDTATSTDQFRRVVRALKRWNDFAILGESPAKPSGIALLLLCDKYLKGQRKFWDGQSNDILAIKEVASSASLESGRLTAIKPTPEWEDVLGGISSADMENLKTRFANLSAVLDQADKHPDPLEACKLLRSVFGEDFPLGDPGDTGQRSSGPAIVPSASSA